MGLAHRHSKRQSMTVESSRPSRMAWRATMRWLLFAGAFACFAGVVAIRQGPPPGGDTIPLTLVTTDLSHGDLRAAAGTSLPDPPGYALLMAPFVAAFETPDRFSHLVPDAGAGRTLATGPGLSQGPVVRR